MNVTLEQITMNPDRLCGKGAAICTDYQGDPLNALSGAMKSGHESVLEHASATFLIEGVSRVLLAQLTRHRIASFSVISQRYCRIVDADIIMPESVGKAGWGENFKRLATKCAHLYQLMVDDDEGHDPVPPEDARYILPQGITCKLMLTMNLRELRHFFSLRCCNRAQWEIRDLADRMLTLCKAEAPMAFADAGPGCVRGYCPEGKKYCGKPRKADDFR